MKTEEFPSGLPVVPQIAFSLWSIRHRMALKPVDSITLLKNWGISNIEIAGFYNLETIKLKNILSQSNIRICSVVGPPLNKLRSFIFYKEWIEKYFEIFESKTFVLQTLPDLFVKYKEIPIDSICGQIYEIADYLNKMDIKVSYHPFPHDFMSINNKSLITSLFDNENKPKNLGLQLDTYWLNAANVEPICYLSWPIHSFHLNERDENGKNCVLGQNPDKCIKYIIPIIQSNSSIEWILENDSASFLTNEGDGEMLNTIKQCIQSWPSFWDSLISQEYEINSDATSLPDLSNYKIDYDLNLIAEEYSPDSEIFKVEIGQVMTEHLLGSGQLDEMDFYDSRIPYYINTRINKKVGSLDEIYYSEKQLFELFWPNDITQKKIIQIVGGSGSGKSTFIRYFFQYFLKYYETLINNFPIESESSQIHQRSFKKHILLYINLRREFITSKMISFIYDKLAIALQYASKIHGFKVDKREDNQNVKDWVIKQLIKIACEIENNERKWYISLILDNSDQMGIKEQNNLIKFLFDWITEEQTIDLSNGDINIKSEVFWKIIIPIRPETLRGLASNLAPIKNREILSLNPINQSLMIEKRADFLDFKICSSSKSPFIDVRFSYVDPENKIAQRDYFDMVVPKEKAPEMKSNMLLANKGISEIDEEKDIPIIAKNIFDNLIGDSARRRIELVSKVAFSNIFRIRKRQGRLSIFYFLESLIRDSNEVFNQDDPNDNIVINFYNMGNSPYNDPYSICVGLHSLYLLKQKKEWEEVFISLQKIGYQKEHLKQCKVLLNSKEIIRGFNNYDGIEYSIINGHWDLLKERAYTDNMAVSCAICWNCPDDAPPTNPLYPGTLLTRFKSSLWFMKKIWEAEKSITSYTKKRKGLNQNFEEFSENYKSLKLPSFTKIISEEYFSSMEKLYGKQYKSTKPVIESEKLTWNIYMAELKKLIEISSAPKALDPNRGRSS